jgi:hypothetical protein
LPDSLLEDEGPDLRRRRGFTVHSSDQREGFARSL